jgi:hypothetical protein
VSGTVFRTVYVRNLSGAPLGPRSPQQDGTLGPIARWRDSDGKQHYKSLGTILDTAKSKAFDEAKEQAGAWIDSCADLVRDELPILTVAQISGTSVSMIEKFYGHLQQRQAEEALARLAL